MATVIDLGTLGSRGFTMLGRDASDLAGGSVSSAGDVNGDGYDDVIVGATWAGAYDGRSYVIYGGPGRTGTVDLSSLPATVGFTIRGTNYGLLSVSNAGDVNGDGFDDLLIGSAEGGFYYSGPTRTYVVFGKSGGLSDIDLKQLAPTAGFVINGPDGQLSVASAGDVNADGFGDIVIGQPSMEPGGSAFLIFGKSSGFGTVDLTNPSAVNGRINGATSFDGLGSSAASAGDINGDGYDDLILGAPFADVGGVGAGQVYVIFGKATAFGTINVGTMTAATGFTIQGDTTGDEAGFQVSAAGDVNGDGYGDLIIGAPWGDDAGDGAGEAYVLFGHAGGFTNIDLTNIPAGAGFIIRGASQSDGAGFSVSGAGDVNGDGFDDLIIGSPFADSGGQGFGNAYVIFGRPGAPSNMDLANLAPSQGFVIRGDNAEDQAGVSVSAAGDLNQDGYDDLIVGASLHDQHGSNSGAAYVIYGRNGFSIDANNDVNGDGRTDFLVRDSNGWLASWSGTANGGFSATTTIKTPPTLAIVGTGDFNGDGRDDLLVRGSDGRVYDWLGNSSSGFDDNGTLTGLQFTADWKVAGTGDFNGDGRSDFLMRRDDGQVTYWRGQANGSFLVNSSANNLTFTSDWKVASVGDFNGDGLSDLLLRRDDGWLTNWLGNTAGGFTNNGANSTVYLGAEWKVAGTGDINGDGKDDLLLRRDDGWLTDWVGSANGSFVNNGANASLNFALEWKIAGIGDIDGNGREDILLRRDDGWVTSWLGTASAGFVNNSANFSTFIAPAWQIQDPFL